MRRQSVKHRAEHARYVKFVRELAAESDRCEVGPLISVVDHGYRDCTLTMQGLHHLQKRSAGGALIDRANVLRSCNPCNSYVENEPILARQAGLVRRAWVP